MNDLDILKNSEVTQRIIKNATKSLTEVPLSLQIIPEFKSEAELTTFGKLILTNFNQNESSDSKEHKESLKSLKTTK